MDQKTTLLDFLKTQKHAVVATVNADGTPEAALVGFGEMDDFTLIFGTNTAHRKYKNLERSPKVALTISTDDTSVQYEGTVSILEGEECGRYTKMFFVKIPAAQKYEHQPGQVFFKVTPSWIRYIHLTPAKEESFEIKF